MSTEYQKNKESRCAQAKIDYLKNREKRLKQMSIWGKENRETIREYKKEWCLKNPDKVKNNRKRFVKNNKGKIKAAKAQRRSMLLQQTPKWADLKAIEEFYKNCPEGHHVDHVIPLKGKNVRGLHVLDNLQYLPALENIRKNNKF